MKIIKSLMIVAASSAQVVCAAGEYTDLASPWCDEENKVIYDGKGYFAVQSPANTELELCINLQSLHSYINSNDYKSGSRRHHRTGRRATGARKPYLTGFWAGNVWKPAVQVSYDTLRQYAAADGTVRVRVAGSSREGVTMTARDSSGATHVLYSAPALKAARNTAVQGYHVNVNYVTAVRLHTTSASG